MNTENNDDNKFRDEYLEYSQGQWRKAKRIGFFLMVIPLLLFSTIFAVRIIPEGLYYVWLAVFIAGGVISVAGYMYWTYRNLNSLYSMFIMPAYFAVSAILLTFSLYFKVNEFIFIFFAVIYFVAPYFLGFFYLTSEYNSFKCSNEIASGITPRKSEDHTAIILPHDRNRDLDGGDDCVMRLINVLKEYNESFQVYPCLCEEDMIDVLKNHRVKRIWIFGHGDRGGCCLTGIYFSYAEFMTEKTDCGWKLREIEPKEYVYQCHCNPKSTTPLTDYLLKEKGLLNPNVDDMPNYYDSGITDMKTDKAKRGKKHSFKVKLCNKLGNMLHEDNKYNDNSSIEYFIKRYAEHLEKKREYMEKTHKNSTVEQ